MAQQTDTSDDLTGTEPAYRDPYKSEPSIRERHRESGRYGIMFAGDYKWDNARCTREAYGDAEQNYDHFRRRSLQFHTTWMDVDEALSCIEGMPDYNRFQPDHVAAVLKTLPETTRVVVGREGSPVLYLWTDHPKAVFSAFSSMSAAESLVDDAEWEEWLTVTDSRRYLPPISPPDELGGVPAPDVDHFPLKVVGDDSAALEAGQPTLLRAWWD